MRALFVRSAQRRIVRVDIVTKLSVKKRVRGVMFGTKPVVYFPRAHMHLLPRNRRLTVALKCNTTFTRACFDICHDVFACALVAL